MSVTIEVEQHQVTVDVPSHPITVTVPTHQIAVQVSGPPGPAGAEGTPILDGDGPPDNAVGDTGAYYLDTHAQILYGPKQPLGQYGDPTNAYGDTGPSLFYAGVYSMGNQFTLLADAEISGLRFYRHASEGATTGRTARLYRPDGTLLATTVASAESSGSAGWVEVALPSPLQVPAGTALRVVVNRPAGYPYGPETASFVPDIRYDGGWFTASLDSFPTSGPDSYTYGTDLTVRLIASDPWPVAITGFDQVSADARYVNVDGDAISGALLVANAAGNVVPLVAKGAPGQAANLFEVRDVADAVKFSVTPSGDIGNIHSVYAVLVRVPGIDLWNDGRIYFANQTVSLGGSNGDLNSNVPIRSGQMFMGMDVGGTYPGYAYVGRKPVTNQGNFIMLGNGSSDQSTMLTAVDVVIMRVGRYDTGEFQYTFSRTTGATFSQPLTLPRDPDTPLQAATKGYVDSRIWQGSQVEYDAITTKDPDVLYVITA